MIELQPDSFAKAGRAFYEQYDGTEYNVYCDESCHLEHDDKKSMALGAVWCSKAKVPEINRRIREIKAKNGIAIDCETKWTKISPCNIELYKDLVDFFFDDDDLCFRSLVVSNKFKLRHEEYQQTHDEWYYKMYFDMLKVIFRPSSHYFVYIDVKDTHSGENALKLAQVCSNNAYDFNHQIIQRIQPIRSDEVQIMQLVDIFTGAMQYRHNHEVITTDMSEAKVELVNRIITRSGCNLTKSTLPTAKKFNVFVWDADWNLR